MRSLAGLPLLAHSLRCAALCPEIDRTIVSTDSDDVAGVARAYGGDVPFQRPSELARDDTPMMPVMKHAVEEVERQEGRRYETVVLLDPTSPGRIPSDVAAAFAALTDDATADGAIAVSRPTFNPFWVGVVERDGALVPAFETQRTYVRRQDVPVFRRINGSLYVWRRDYVVGHEGAWHERRHVPIEIPEARAFSIDDLYEFQVAELLLTSGLLELPWLTEKR